MSQKKQQTAAGLFFSMLLRAAVVILGIGIVVFGVFFVTQALKGGPKDNTPATTLDENALTDAQIDELQMNPSVEESAQPVEEQVAVKSTKDCNILVLNSTDVAGLAGRWCETLNADGYANTNASDYSETVESTRIIAREDGVGMDLVAYFSNASYEVGTVTRGTTEPTDNYDIVIIIGTSDSDH